MLVLCVYVGFLMFFANVGQSRVILVFFCSIFVSFWCNLGTIFGVFLFIFVDVLVFC